MFELQRATAKIAAFNPRAEKHGEGNVTAVDIKLEVLAPNSALFAFDKDLCVALYRPARPGDQQSLLGGGGALVAVRFPRLGQLSWDEEFPGYEIELERGLGLSYPLHIVDVTLKKFRFEAIEGGVVKITFNAVFHPDAEEAGAICKLIQEDVELTLIPPTRGDDGAE